MFDKHILSASSDNTIKVWDQSQASPISTSSVGATLQNITSLDCSPDKSGKLIVAAEVGGCEVYLFDDLLQGGQVEPAVHAKHIGCYLQSFPVFAVCISPDSSLLAVGGGGGELEMWDFGERDILYSMSSAGDSSRVSALTFSPKDYFVSAASPNWIKTWDLETKALLQWDELECISKVFTLNVSESPDCLRLSLTNLGGSEVLAWEASSDAFIADAAQTICDHLKYAGVVVFSDSNEVLDDSPIKSYVSSKLTVNEKKAYTSVEWTSDGEHLLAGATDGCIHTYQFRPTDD